MERLIIALLVTAAWVALPAAILTQQTQQEVRVHLADRSGAGVPGITITLRDEAGSQIVGSAATDVLGDVIFPDVTLSTVRLSVSGAAPSGASVSLGEVSFADDDAILVQTGVGGPLVDLVMDTNGMVYINPETLEPEGENGGPALSPAPEQATIAATPTPSQSLASGESEAVGRNSHQQGWVLWLIVGGAILSGGVVVLLGSERRVL